MSVPRTDAVSTPLSEKPNLSSNEYRLNYVRYWDWVLDYQDPASSPVFDAQLGFGGNGDSALGESPVGGGHCVTDGPFAMTLARYVGLEVKPHCLSRNFRNDTAIGRFTGHLIRPDLVNKYMDENDLLLFTLKLESGPHNTIPFGIRGDFLSFNAPAGKPSLQNGFPALANEKQIRYSSYIMHSSIDCGGNGSR